MKRAAPPNGSLIYGWLLVVLFLEYARPASFFPFLNIPFFYSAVPLLLFAAAARRLPLVYLGLTQYLAPVIQFLVGVFIFLEEMPPARWAGFGLVWLALIVLTIDMLRSNRVARRAALEPI